MRVSIFILLFPILSFSQSKDYKTFDKAVKYNKRGDVQKSIKYANKALENNPEWNQPNLLLASIYANSKQIRLAADHLLRVYDENDPNDVKGVEKIAKLYYSNGFYNEALFYAQSIISLNIDTYRLNNEIDRYVEN